jgi:TolA-binding protein
MATGKSVILQARYPEDLRVVGRALGVNLSEAAVRGVVQAICSAAGITGHDSLSRDMEIALLSTLRSRRDELASELEELTEYISRIEDLEEARKQQAAERQIEVRRQQEQAATFEAIAAAKSQFDAALPSLHDQDLSALRAALETGDIGDVAATVAEVLVTRNGLTMPHGADPAQWLVDYMVATRGSA